MVSAAAIFRPAQLASLSSELPSPLKFSFSRICRKAAGLIKEVSSKPSWVHWDMISSSTVELLGLLFLLSRSSSLKRPFTWHPAPGSKWRLLGVSHSQV